MKKEFYIFGIPLAVLFNNPIKHFLNLNLTDIEVGYKVFN